MVFTQTIRSALAELKVNPRLRWGAWLIIGMVWLYGILVLREQVEKKAGAYQGTLKKIARIQKAAAQMEWPSRLEAAQALRLNLESRLWREGTIGLAQAGFQDWLNQAVQQAGLPKAALTVAAQEDTGAADKSAVSSGKGDTPLPPGLWKVSAKLVFDFNPKSFYPFLARLTTHEKWILVESLTIRGSPVPRAEMVVVAFFQKPKPLQEGEAHETKERRA